VKASRSLSRVALDIRRSDPSDLYAAFHAVRYAFLLRALADYITDARCRVLDIGPSKLTALIAQTFGVRVQSLGLSEHHDAGASRHYTFDLNESQEPARWRADLGPYDVVVMAEVLEHLHTSPARVLAFVRTLLAPHGVLIIQTPNALALHKRLKLLAGRHPYEPIREDVRNPGHFREYTAGELRHYAEGAGLVVERCSHESYFDYRFLYHPDGSRYQPRWHLTILNACYRLVPPTLRPGLTCVARYPAHAMSST